MNNINESRIFIVDDEQANIKLIERILATQGYTNLVPISDPRVVLEKYLDQRPDIVLLDINMPHIDGYGVMAKLKELQDPLLPPIVILTAQHSKDYLLRALSAGARDYISKPFDRNELLMRVRNLLEAQLAHLLLYDQKNVLEDMVKKRTAALHHTRLQVIQRLGMAAEYRDEETGQHILRMSHICSLLAKEIGWDDELCDLILNASPMHDIGKIGIPDAVLLKPGRFDSHEWEIMKEHVSIGARLLEGDDSELMVMAKEIALTHHEKWDGSGYPYGLMGNEIPLSGRIAAIADVFDALTSARPYKKPWSLDEALNYIKQNSGRHFDPNLVTTFIRVLPRIIDIKKQFSDSP